LAKTAESASLKSRTDVLVVKEEGDFRRALGSAEIAFLLMS
jgi:hypothetical protein